MKFTKTEAEHILMALEFGIKHTALQGDLDRFINLKSKINKKLNRLIPVVHYYWYDEVGHEYTEMDYQGQTNTLFHRWQHPMAVAPCGMISYVDQANCSNGDPRYLLTKTTEDVTCKKCRKWLRLDPAQSLKPKPVRLERNISLDL